MILRAMPAVALLLIASAMPESSKVMKIQTKSYALVHQVGGWALIVEKLLTIAVEQKPLKRSHRLRSNGGQS
jgi:hypothetical protein